MVRVDKLTTYIFYVFLHIVCESRLERGWIGKSEIYNLKDNLQAGVSVRNKIESKREGENKSQANEADDTMICFTEVRFLQT
jgi:cytidylate kinase